MQLSSSPAKLTLAFATSGGKNTIPVGVNPTPGGASFTEGYPPLTRTPLAGGGIPPSGLDTNGVLFSATAVSRWLNAGAGFVYDAVFAADADVGGYPKGSQLICADGIGSWLSIAEDNTADPDAGGAGWVPGLRYGSVTVPMSSSNVTLSATQYRKPIIIITGTLTADLNLIFPTLISQWLIVNQTVGGFTVTCKTASGTGVVVPTTAPVWGDGTNINLSALDTSFSLSDVCAHATGTANALVATFPNIMPAVYTDGIPFYVRAAVANTTAVPTITFNPGVLTPVDIVKANNKALRAGDIAGAGHWLCLQYDTTLGKVVLNNPAFNPATQVETDAGLINTCSVTPEMLANSVYASIGWNQDWVAVTRTIGTLYTNNTGKPIALTVLIGRGGPDHIGLNIEINGLAIPFCHSSNSGGGNTAVGDKIIPAGATYKLVSLFDPITSSSAFELR